MIVFAHPSAAALHVFGREMPREWLQALCASSAKALYEHIEVAPTIKGDAHSKSMIEMLATLGQVLPLGLPTVFINGATLAPAPLRSADFAALRHDLDGIGFVCFLMATPITIEDEQITAIHLFNRALAHPSLDGLTAHFSLRRGEDATSWFVRIDTDHKDTFDAVLADIAQGVSLALLPANAA